MRHWSSCAFAFAFACRGDTTNQTLIDFVRDHGGTFEFFFLFRGEGRTICRALEEMASQFVENVGTVMDTNVGELADTTHGRENLSTTDLVTAVNSFYTVSRGVG